MAVSSKGRFAAEQDIWNFVRKHKDCYFWTFTFEDNLQDKDEAERRFKVLRDYFDRNGVDYIGVWERQKRGAFHPHLLIDRRLDVTTVRDFLTKRGFGRIMKVEYVRKRWTNVDGKLQHDERDLKRVVGYLLKYLMKAPAEGFERKKAFICPHRVKTASTAFKWAPWFKPGAMLYAAGAPLFRLTCPELCWKGVHIRFGDIAEVIRIGVRESNWLDVDPWYWETVGGANGERG